VEIDTFVDRLERTWSSLTKTIAKKEDDTSIDVSNTYIEHKD
jgi:hypothetical protein